jgi:hypothetical protein
VTKRLVMPGIGVDDRHQLSQLFMWLTPSAWDLQVSLDTLMHPPFAQKLSKNPYSYNSDGTLACTAGVGFPIGWSGLQACAPCAKQTMHDEDTCAIMQGVVSTFIGCNALGAPDTLANVCQGCRDYQSIGATLLARTDGDTSYDDFASIYLTGVTVGSQANWPCRYACPVGTYVNTCPIL